MKEYLEVSYFQLENLIISNMRFLVFDFSSQDIRPQAVEKSFEQIQFWKRCRSITPEVFLNSIQRDQIEISGYEMGSNPPVVLICEDGSISAKMAENLLQNGFTQVLVVEGGKKQLYRDWSSETST